MRWQLGLAVIVVSLLFGRFVQADEAKARKLVEQSLKAAGGADKIAKRPATTIKDRGMYYGAGEGVAYEGIFSFHLPDKVSMEISGAFKIVVNGNQGWVKANNETREMTAEEIDTQKSGLYHGWVASLLPVTQKEFKLSLFGEEKLDGRDVEGINVTREGRPNVTLFFDKQTHLLVKSTTVVKSPEQGNKEVAEVHLYKDYKPIDGLQSPTKSLVTRDGKKFVESEVVEEVRHEKLDDSVFAKP